MQVIIIKFVSRAFSLLLVSDVLRARLRLFAAFCEREAARTEMAVLSRPVSEFNPTIRRFDLRLKIRCMFPPQKNWAEHKLRAEIVKGWGKGRCGTVFDSYRARAMLNFAPSTSRPIAWALVS